MSEPGVFRQLTWCLTYGWQCWMRARLPVERTLRRVVPAAPAAQHSQHRLQAAITQIVFIASLRGVLIGDLCPRVHAIAFITLPKFLEVDGPLWAPPPQQEPCCVAIHIGNVSNTSPIHNCGEFLASEAQYWQSVSAMADL